MGFVRVVHRSPLGVLVVPTPDGVLIRAEQGVPVSVPAVIAGRAPGDWEPVPAGVVVDDDSVSHQFRRGAGGVMMRTQGAGLLASPDWALAPEVSKEKTKSAPAKKEA